MVVAVSLRKASEPSYSSIVGAENTRSVSVCAWPENPRRRVGNRLTGNVSGDVERGGGTEAFGGGRTDGELVRDAWVELGERVVGGVGGQGHREPRPLEGHGRVEGAHAAVADLRRGDTDRSGRVFQHSTATVA